MDDIYPYLRKMFAEKIVQLEDRIEVLKDRHVKMLEALEEFERLMSSEAE